MIRLAAATAALAVTVLSAGAASASDYRLAFGDLDLGSARDAADRAARAACASGSPLSAARCRRDFQSEVMRLLPQAHREDYARTRTERIVARAPDDQS